MHKLFNSFKKYIWNKHSDNESQMLILLGALGWILGSVAQIGGIITNKNLSKKEKNFLIPQEAIDGALNVGLYLGITQFAATGMQKLLDKNIIQILNKEGKSVNNKHAQAMCTLATIAASVLACNIITPITRNYLSAIYQKKAQKDNIKIPKLTCKTTFFKQNPYKTQQQYNNFLYPSLR